MTVFFLCVWPRCSSYAKRSIQRRSRPCHSPHDLPCHHLLRNIARQSRERILPARYLLENDRAIEIRKRVPRHGDGLSTTLLASIDNELIRAFIRLDTQSLFIEEAETNCLQAKPCPGPPGRYANTIQQFQGSRVLPRLDSYAVDALHQSPAQGRPEFQLFAEPARARLAELV